MILEPEAEPARDDDAGRAVRKREIARDRAEAEAEAVERGDGEAVLALQRQRSDFLVGQAVDRFALNLRQRFVDRDDARPGHDPLG